MFVGQMGKKLLALLEDQEQMGVQDARDWVAENDAGPFLTDRQTNDVVGWGAQRGRNIWHRSDDRTTLIFGPKEVVHPDPVEMEEG